MPWKIALLAFPAVALLAACGGGSGDDPASPSPARSASPGASASPSATVSPGASPSPGETGSPGASAVPGTPTATPTPDIATPVAREPFEPADGAYCDTVTASSPPNSIIGLLVLEGADAPAGTEVMVAFDGVPGPVAATREAGGYRIDFGVSTDASCANKAGAELSVVINGVEYASGRVVGSAAAIRFDIVE